MMIGSATARRILADGRLPFKRRAEQIMSMPAAQRRWTAREVRQLIADNPLHTPRYELVDGELLVTPSPSFVHQRAVDRLYFALAIYLLRNPIGEVYTSPSDVELESNSMTQPDLFVLPIHEVRRLLEAELPARELLLSVEVLSPSSGRSDKVKKRFLYTRQIPEYWIVDTDSRVFERWRKHETKSDMIVDSLVWHPEGAAESFTLDLSAYFADVCGDPAQPE
jgi:Uma2 family endonuclease